MDIIVTVLLTTIVLVFTIHAYHCYSSTTTIVLVVTNHGYHCYSSTHDHSFSLHLPRISLLQSYSRPLVSSPTTHIVTVLLKTIGLSSPTTHIIVTVLPRPSVSLHLPRISLLQFYSRP